MPKKKKVGGRGTGRMTEEPWNSQRLRDLRDMSTKCSVCDSWFEQVNNRILLSINLIFIEGIGLNTWLLPLHSHNQPIICVLLMFPYYPWEFELSRFTWAEDGGDGPQLSLFFINHKLCFSIYCISATSHGQCYSQ